ncbi:hypothetical protein H4S07_001268, partial [Coemansia furcata]
MARLQRVISWVIDKQQTGFLQDWSIFDNIHTINLAIECSLLNPETFYSAILMLDQQKAYDQVDWAYLDQCMEH